MKFSEVSPQFQIINGLKVYLSGLYCYKVFPFEIIPEDLYNAITESDYDLIIKYSRIYSSKIWNHGIIKSMIQNIENKLKQYNSLCENITQDQILLRTMSFDLGRKKSFSAPIQFVCFNIETESNVLYAALAFYIGALYDTFKSDLSETEIIYEKIPNNYELYCLGKELLDIQMIHKQPIIKDNLSRIIKILDKDFEN